ncbi:hypothetical protein [uncultured Sulfitobacter sp.]|uniref:hypothetical protein n=1 Tax=uncultured Sulfitobacter sp. TaxID=191468 RepID=UPI00260D7054|nr:hypothetical protein [uncultured Sulfitobacter sp.]
MTTCSTNTTVRPASPLMEKSKARVTAVTQSLEFKVLTGLLMVLMPWGAAIATFGYVAFITVMLALVPTAFVLLILITVGK